VMQERIPILYGMMQPSKRALQLYRDAIGRG